jgi:hypothetical protein
MILRLGSVEGRGSCNPSYYTGTQLYGLDEGSDHEEKERLRDLDNNVLRTLN